MVADPRAAGARLIIVCGLPGAGKTTHARRLERALGAVRMSADDWMHALAVSLYDEPFRAKIEALQWVLAQQLLSRGLTVAIEWGTWGRDEREALRTRARDLGAAVELHWLDAPREVLWQRIVARGAEDPPMTRERVFSWVFYEPTDEEMTRYDRAHHLRA